MMVRALCLLVDCVVSVWELGLARIALDRVAMAEIARRNAVPGKRVSTADDAQLLDRIGYVLPRVGRRLPWRADCLVQALAGQRWLRRKGLASRITIGVDNQTDATFAAHAWLLCGERVVTGGDISRYAPIFGEETLPDARKFGDS